MLAKYFRMPVQKKTVEKGKERVYLYNKEFALKTYIVERPRDYYMKNNLNFVQMVKGYTKGNEILLQLKFDKEKRVYIETWANKTKYNRANKLGKYAEK